jgi:hypothetical protein
MNQVDPGGVLKPEERMAKVRPLVQFLTDFLNGHNKTESQGIMLDSATYTTTTGDPTSTLQWAFDLVTGSSSSAGEIGGAIGRLVRDIARVMSAEWMLLGDTGSGSDAMHEDKTAMFGLVANGTLDDIADDTGRDVAARLVALNGLDPETCTPRLEHEPIARGSVADAARTLLTMFQAGMKKKDPATDIMRARLDLPPAPEDEEPDLGLPQMPPGAEIDPGMPVTAPGAQPAEQGGVAAPTGVQAARSDERAPVDDGKAGNVNARTAAKRRVRKAGFSEDDHPRDEHGKFTEGGGSSGPSGGGGSAGGSMRSDSDHEQAAASLSDHNFVMQHGARLSAAADSVRGAFPREEHGLNDVHDAAQAAIREEVVRINRGEGPQTASDIQQHADRVTAERNDLATAQESAASGHHAERLTIALENGREAAWDRLRTDQGRAAHDVIMSRLDEEKRAIANEQAARDAGHVKEFPHAALDEYQGVRDSIASEATAIQARLDSLHGEALDALDQLRARHVVDDNGDDITTPLDDEELSGHLVASGLQDVTGTEGTDYENREQIEHDNKIPDLEISEEPTPPDDPDDPDDPDEAEEHQERLAAYHRELSEYRQQKLEHDAAVDVAVRDYKAHAERAQVTLERLHAAQVDANQQLELSAKRSRQAEKAVSAEFERTHADEAEDGRDNLINASVFTAHEFDEESRAYKDPQVNAQLDRAMEAASSLQAYEESRRERLLSHGDSESLSDALRSAVREIKEKSSATAQALRRLSKITGRPAKLAGKTTKAAARRAIRKAEFSEDDHPRDEQGRFAGSGSGASASGAQADGQRAALASAAGSAARPLNDSGFAIERAALAERITPTEHSAAQAYTSNDYVAINGLLRAGSDFGLTEDDETAARETIRHLDTLMDKARISAPVITYRGSEPHPAFMAMQAGDVFVDHAFVSTSVDKDAQFGGGVIFHVTSPAGTKIAAVPSHIEEEKEMLLGRGVAMRVDRRETKKDGRGKDVHVFHVTVVGQH